MAWRERYPDASNAGKRQNLLHRDARDQRVPLGGVLRKSFRLADSNRANGSIAFDDGVGEVSGTWVTGRPAPTSPGLLIYIMVDNVAATIDTLIAHGGEFVQPIGADAPEITARFRDTAGNVLGLYHHPR
jgi:predicted enzyme related to lactoylglutathione lyase